MFKVLVKPDTGNLSMCVEYSKTTEYTVYNLQISRGGKKSGKTFNAKRSQQRKQETWKI